MLGTGCSVFIAVREVMPFAPGTPVRFLIIHGVVAAFTLLFTSAWAIGGMVVDRRFLLNALFVLIAASAFPLSSWTLFYTAERRGVILKP